MEPTADNSSGDPTPTGKPATPGALALFFLRLGLTAFGGPAAHIAMMEEETVRRRGWLSKEQFLDLLGAANLIPGPSSTEMAIYIGYLRAGWTGLIVAGVCFIAPAFFLVMGIAWAYVRLGHLPQMQGVLYGVKPVVIAVIVQALWGLGRTAVRTKLLGMLGLAAVALAFLGVNPLLILFGAGILVGGGRWLIEERKKGFRPMAGVLLLVALLVLAPLLLGRFTATASAFGLLPLFLFFLKVGSVVYGSGYVLLAFLRTDLVARWGWLSSAQLLDAVAVGQVTPGPVFTTATFIGYLLAGPKGAVIATVGIFLPSFLLVGAMSSLLPRFRRSPVAGAFLDGVNVAALALMAEVSWQLGQAAIVDGVTAAIALASGFLLLRYRANSAWLVLGGAIMGLIVFAWR
jgi:chromate transporter